MTTSHVESKTGDEPHKLSRAHSFSHPEDQASDLPSRRSVIVQSALELFAVAGYRATTMSAIGERAGIRGPSIYKHFSSKQDLLEEIMFTTMERLLKNNAAALSNTNDNVVAQLRSSVEMHARFHAHHGYEAFVGTREINSLNEPKRSELLSLRDRYERGFRELIERGRTQSLFHVESSRLASYAIIDMGMGIAVWFRDDGPFNADEVIRHYGSMALRLVGYVDPS